MECYKTPTEYKYNIKLKDISKKLGISKSSIVEILRESGSEAFDISDFLLNDTHLTILSLKYVESVKNLQSRLNKKYYSSNLNEKAQIRKFLLRFIDKKDINNSVLFDDGITKLKLDTKLILDFFFNLIDEIRTEISLGKLYSLVKNDDKNLRKFLHKIKVKIKRHFNNNNSKIFFTTITGHYYIFTGDEEHIVEEKLKKSFSTIKYSHGEVLNKINNLIFIINGKHTTINRKYTQLQFV